MTTYELPPLPGEEALKSMRKKARKRKIPNPKVGSSGRLPGVGEFRIVENDGVVCLQWQMADSEPKRFSFDALSRDPDRAEQRLEVGWLIANLWMVEGHRIRDAIPGPNEAMRESAPYFDSEERWRHWAQVAAGHMLF
jgi:hypothetical protein